MNRMYTPMTPSDLEPGMLLLGVSGQIREIVSIEGKEVTYRQIRGGRVATVSLSPKVGTTRTVSTKTLARWVFHEVTEEAAS